VYIHGSGRLNSRWKAILDAGYALHGTRCRNTYELCSELRRMLFEWQGILQFISQSGFSYDSVFFFSFTVHSCFIGILKTSAYKRGTKPQKTLYRYNLKSLTFKHSLLSYIPSKIKHMLYFFL